MYWDVITVRLLTANELAVAFRDGLTGTLVIDPNYCTGVFTALCDTQLIGQVQVCDGVLTCPNGLDIATDTLYWEMKQHPEKRYVLFNHASETTR